MFDASSGTSTDHITSGECLPGTCRFCDQQSVTVKSNADATWFTGNKITGSKILVALLRSMDSFTM